MPTRDRRWPASENLHHDGRSKQARLRSNADGRLSVAAALRCLLQVEVAPDYASHWDRHEVATPAPAIPLSLEKIDDTLIKVIARVHDLHLAFMFKVLDDLAARRNLPRA
jgi:hypothetical protein